MIEYALYIQKRGYVPFGGFVTSTDRDNDTYCAKFVRGVALEGGIDWDWDWNSFTGKQNIEDVVEDYGVKKIEIDNKKENYYCSFDDICCFECNFCSEFRAHLVYFCFQLL